MTRKAGKTVGCELCKTTDCMMAYPRGVPAYCPAGEYQDILEQTKREYLKPVVNKMFVASRKITTTGYGRWTRIQEAIEFAKELGLKRIGIAVCVGLIGEGKDITELFKGAGFEAVCCVSCHIGAVQQKDWGVPEEYWGGYGTACNPIAQAEVLNREATELNFTVGLCIGHDAIFNKYSEAPVSALIVKDRVTAHNPAAALHSFYHRSPLWKQYCGKEISFTGRGA